MGDNPDGHSLSDRINAKDASAFDELFGLYYPVMCHFAAGILKDDATAEDTVQEVFIRFWEKHLAFPNLNALRSFLYTAVQNKTLNHLEKHTNRRRIRENIHTESSTENEFLLQQVEADLLGVISSEIDRLPEQCRKVFTMSFVEERNISEVAEELHIAETTVKTQRRRARQILRDRLRELFPARGASRKRPSDADKGSPRSTPQNHPQRA